MPSTKEVAGVKHKGYKNFSKERTSAEKD